MPTIVVEIDRRPGDLGPEDIERLAPALPAILDRLRRLTFGADGVAVLDPAGRREGLRLTGGTAGSVGARYCVVTMLARPDGTSATAGLEAPVDVEVLRDDAQQLEVTLSQNDQHGHLVLEQPDQPVAIRLMGEVTVADLPAVLGGEVVHADLVIQIAGFGAADRPQCRVELALGRVAGRGSLHLLPTGDTIRARLELQVRLHGVLGPLTLLWPFVRSRAVAAARTELAGVLAGVDDSLRALLAEGTDPHHLADRALADLPDALAVIVPQDPPV